MLDCFMCADVYMGLLPTMEVPNKSGGMPGGLAAGSHLRFLAGSHLQKGVLHGHTSAHHARVAAARSSAPSCLGAAVGAQHPCVREQVGGQL
jgi:hypothetical protein